MSSSHDYVSPLGAELHSGSDESVAPVSAAPRMASVVTRESLIFMLPGRERVALPFPGAAVADATYASRPARARLELVAELHDFIEPPVVLLADPLDKYTMQDAHLRSRESRSGLGSIPNQFEDGPIARSVEPVANPP